MIAVHPRECGEHSGECLTVRVQNGSSPRVRGTSILLRRRPQRVRFIPASAGNISTKRMPRPSTPVHPRECGEHTGDSWLTCTLDGSSPRVRGTSIVRANTYLNLRFIPASAGNMNPYIMVARYITVHPRECGEHSTGDYSPTALNGSSPRVRGTFRTSTGCVYPARFIPASAGNMKYLPLQQQCHPVHPRECGEHCCKTSNCSWFSGSSPRVRGTYDQGLDGIRRGRFIPASAGNMMMAFTDDEGRPVHPRECGEHYKKSFDDT